MEDVELAFTPAWRLAEMMRRQEVSPVEVTETALRRIDRLNPRLNAFLTVDGDQAMALAREVEIALSEGKPKGPLHGVPVSIKDLLDTKGLWTTFGSLVLRDRMPEEDAVVVERIREAGGIILGKTNTSEFGHSATTENRLRDDCSNPWDPTRTTGGSSGGAAAAIASGLGPVGIGSDAGGSIRVPAAFCGIYGIKPTQGRVPGYGGVGGMPMFSQNGPMARSVRDAALLLSVISGWDRRDPRSLEEEPAVFAAALEGDIRGMKVAWTPDLGCMAIDPEVQAIVGQAARHFAELGCIVEDADPPITDDAYDIFRVIVSVDSYVALRDLVENHEDDLMPYVRSTLEHGAGIMGHEYSSALRGLERFRSDMWRFFNNYDLLLTPTTAVPAFPVGRRPTTVDGHKVSKMWGAFPLTMPFNLTGQPAASLPAGFTEEGLPVGLMVVGRWGEESAVLRASAAYEGAFPWAQHRPAAMEAFSDEV